jgi:acetyl-CoA acetyltransferase
MDHAYVTGVGMTKFEKPGRHDHDYPDLAREAGQRALADAGLSYDEIEQAYVGYVYGESTSGERAVYELGVTGIPVVNVNNNCSTGSSALFLARQAVASGSADCVLALGFEKMQRGSLEFGGTDRAGPLDRHIACMADLYAPTAAPVAPQLFGNAGREHMERYGTTVEQFAKIAVKNHAHSVNNPYAQFQEAYTLDEVLASQQVHEPLTRLQCSPTSDGAAAAIVCSRRFVEERDLGSRAIEIVAQAMTTDRASTWDDRSAISLVGGKLSEEAAKAVYAAGGVGPEDIQVIELHDCFSCNELLTYEALGLCGEGEGGQLIDAGDVTYGGRWVVNPSGGLISKGHPLGATGLAQCAECTWQLRGEAGGRQADAVDYALAHNIGLGGAAVVTLYRRAS